MSKNGWIACIIVMIVFSCICLFCFTAGLIGIASFLYITPDISSNIPFDFSEQGIPTSTPVVIRPPTQVQAPTPLSTLTPGTPSSEASPTPFIISSPVLVPTDTLYALENTFIPVSDPIELAHRLLHLDNLSPTVDPPASTLQTGVQETFWVSNGDDENFTVKATLRNVTSHAYFWIEEGVEVHQRDLTALADVFENQIYPVDRDFFGSEWTPGVDGDPHIYILYARGIGEGIAGYFSSADEFPPGVNKYSNAHEMFVFNADNSPLGQESTYGTLAHEFQHMIHWYQDRNEANWLNEGFSELAVLLNHYDPGGFDVLFINNPDLQLNDWPDESHGDPTPHYGASFLFTTYFLDRFGEAATQALVTNQDNDLQSLDSTLRQINAIDPLTGEPVTANRFFLDWAVTNYVLDPQVGDGRYNYPSYSGAPSADPTFTYDNCPIAPATSEVHQYGVDYIRFTCPGSYTLHFEGSIQVPLLPQDPHSGRYAMWANKNDESDTLLTQTFDLSNYSAPLSLNYWTWYDIEKGWDYVYLEASTDGENWQILTTPSGTADNPQGNNYGWAYTGVSGGYSKPGWINETVDISQFAGQKLSLRFEYITDSNVTGEGFLLDDLSIPEIGYFTDFETDNAGWQEDGWVRIENILPQTYGMALISNGDDTNVQYININPDITADIPFTIGSGVDDVVLVVSGTTRFTRQVAPYRISISQP
jgi:immune inhibitor A